MKQLIKTVPLPAVEDALEDKGISLPAKSKVASALMDDKYVILKEQNDLRDKGFTCYEIDEENRELVLIGKRLYFNSVSEAEQMLVWLEFVIKLQNELYKASFQHPNIDQSDMPLVLDGLSRLAVAITAKRPLFLAVDDTENDLVSWALYYATATGSLETFWGYTFMYVLGTRPHGSDEGSPVGFFSKDTVSAENAIRNLRRFLLRLGVPIRQQIEVLTSQSQMQDVINKLMPAGFVPETTEE